MKETSGIKAARLFMGVSMDGRAKPRCTPKPCNQCKLVYTPNSNGQWYCSDECTFRANSVAKESGCWEWAGVRDTKDGYGVINIKGRSGRTRAHRFSYEMHKGEIPEGLVVRHKCDNPCCVNPDHLELGTHADNTADSVSKGRHVHGEKMHTAKLTEQDVLDIRGSSLSSKELALKYGVDSTNIWCIRAGKTWKHLLQAKQSA